MYWKPSGREERADKKKSKKKKGVGRSKRLDSFGPLTHIKRK
jgi:hypothetical protein